MSGSRDTHPRSPWVLRSQYKIYWRYWPMANASQESKLAQIRTWILISGVTRRSEPCLVPSWLLQEFAPRSQPRLSSIGSGCNKKTYNISFCQYLFRSIWSRVEGWKRSLRLPAPTPTSYLTAKYNHVEQYCLFVARYEYVFDIRILFFEIQQTLVYVTRNYPQHHFTLILTPGFERFRRSSRGQPMRAGALWCFYLGLDDYKCFWILQFGVRTPRSTSREEYPPWSLYFGPCSLLWGFGTPGGALYEYAIVGDTFEYG